MSKIIAQLLVAAVCVAIGFSLGRMYPADKGPSPRPAGPSSSASTNAAPRSGALPIPKGAAPTPTHVSVAPGTGPEPDGHEHAAG